MFARIGNLETFLTHLYSYLLAKKVNEISLLEKHVETLASPG